MLTDSTAKKKPTEFWDAIEQGILESAEKLKFLRNFKSNRNLVLVQYPSGSTLKMLNQVCKCLQKAEFSSFEDFVTIQIDVGHSRVFHLIKNNTHLHDSFEKRQKATGGINSIEILDLGEFRVAHVNSEDEILDKADYTLYSTSDVFSI